MIDYGFSALIAATFISLAQGVASHWLFKKFKDDALLAVRLSSVSQFILILIGFISIVLAFITSDFSLMITAFNSATFTPMIYKIVGIWSNHEGSMLLWVLVLSGFGALYSLTSFHHPKVFVLYTLALQSFMTFAFLIYTLFFANPFERFDGDTFDGIDMNPILQDPSMLTHPPSLYLGFVGFSLIFSMGVAGLITEKIDKAWAKHCRPWALMLWAILTLGVIGGSWWAYYELGWGGWWFWDPVENISLIPWLLASALIHSLKHLESKEQSKQAAVLLAILVFSSALLGTFIVRSGLVMSVHSFSEGGERSVALFLVIGTIIASGLSVYAVKAHAIKFTILKSPFLSLNGLMKIQLIVMTTLAFTVLLGTLYPVFLEAITGTKISVGPPYFEATFVPIAFIGMTLAGLGPFLLKKQNFQELIRALMPVLIVMLVVTLLLLFIFERHLCLSCFGLLFGSWLILTSLKGLLRKQSSFFKVKQLPMIVAHIGVGICVLGVSWTSLVKEETLLAMPLHKPYIFHNFKIELLDVQKKSDTNYSTEKAKISVAIGTENTILEPERRIYHLRNTQTIETALLFQRLTILYIALGDRLEDGRWSLRVYYHPNVLMIWMGGVVMILGVLLAIVFARKNH
ncbi:heme lyase CcmF/NrfE family subunit [Candidatus Nucleicultrix amoebiphila]|jgi:cytochrome c-type biogenesis protein CcmF|uniref:Cytochrome C biogenesis protein CcmF n=1 Tax=Candidatus Nucleicultrix amoebiphila FS5 TaxID=1414854 RepID=A0A1W6N3C6_9PROT|nr:heme lyase CcmF/NrfE family subunit [Candidatus Nucleicultrix amoebiphila]ARN84384.1 hypothetical protein GQ61_02515 [Candidatus Nucleicultrix amoebiphila FS5]